MAAQSILGRITQMARANLNALLDGAEDPEVMLDQMIRDYTASIGEAENAVAMTIGNLRLMEQDAREATTAAQEWGAKARAASARADQLTTAGNVGEAAKFDNLARIALQKQLTFETDARNFVPAVAEQTAVTEKLREGLTQMHVKLDDLRRKRDQLVSRAKVNEARQRVNEATAGIDMLDPSTEIGRFEEKIRREEARLQGQEELAASSLDAQFESLDDLARDAEVEARLSALKSPPAAAGS